MQKFLFSRIDNSPLIAFRILFGGTMFWQSAKHIYSGWVYNMYIKPQFTFSFIGFGWLQPLPGKGMYWYHIIMCIMALLVAIGYKYRPAVLCYGILWAGTYFMQKTVYNNHHYLLILICLIMYCLPANAYASVDSYRNPAVRRQTMPAWCRYVIIVQIAIVYFYAGIAKLYPGWLNGTFSSLLLSKPGAGRLAFIANNHWFHLFIAYSGILFDLFVIPLLLFRRTRVLAIVASLIFHLFNSATLNIGVFPFFSLSLLVFFFPPEKIRRAFFWRKPVVVNEDSSIIVPAKGKKMLLYFFIPYFIIQVGLPLRHHFIKGDVLWTEEGHRLSWRMMLRKRRGTTVFRVKELPGGKETVYDVTRILTKRQIKTMMSMPDMIWQTAQRIKEEYAKKGIKVAVYVTSRVSINHSPERLFINPDADLASLPWNYFTHNDWILLYDD